MTMIAEKRRQEILKLIEEKGSVRITNLGKIFKVTDMTIRRDIDHLSKLGLVKRVHGGAIAGGSIAGGRDNINLATTFLKRDKEFKTEKDRIGIKAQEFVEDNSTIIIDGGSTNECFAKHLNSKLKLKVITHGLNIAWILSKNENYELFIIGGKLNRLTMTFSGREVETTYEEFNADVIFLAASGISIEKGLTDPAWLDTSIKKAMIRSSRKVILLIDSHKFGLISSRKFASLNEVDTIITDRNLPNDIREMYIKAGANIIIA